LFSPPDETDTFDDDVTAGVGMGLQAATQFWLVSAEMCAVDVSTARPPGAFVDEEDVLEPVAAPAEAAEVVLADAVEADWMRLETAADATSLKSASLDARLTPATTLDAVTAGFLVAPADADDG